MIEVTRTSTTTLRKVDPAQFLSFRYRNTSGEDEGKHSERHVLALGYKRDERLLHGLDLEKFSDQNLIAVGRELAEMSQDRESFEETFAEEGQVLLENVFESEVESWYDTEYSADQFEENPYRTFRKDGIRNLRRAEVTITT